MHNINLKCKGNTIPVFSTNTNPEKVSVKIPIKIAIMVIKNSLIINTHVFKKTNNTYSESTALAIHVLYRFV